MMAGVTWWNLGDGTAYENENKALGGLLDKDMNPKPAYQALDKLINHEWKTNLTLATDAQGKARFRGFPSASTRSQVTAGQPGEAVRDRSLRRRPGPHKLTLKP